MTKISEYTDTCKLPTDRLSSRVSQPSISKMMAELWHQNISCKQVITHWYNVLQFYTCVVFHILLFQHQREQSECNIKVNSSRKAIFCLPYFLSGFNNDSLSPTQVFLDQSNATGVQYSITISCGHKSTFITAYYTFALKQ